MNSLLQVQSLDVEYVPRTGMSAWALLDVSFEVMPGEILGILGESGSGKSTLAASLVNLLPGRGKIRGGQIFFDGTEVRRLLPSELQKFRGGRISLIFQEPLAALHPTMRIGHQIAEVLRAHESLNGATRRERVRHILAQVFPSDVESIMHSYPHELSGGQRQRVLIAQAIACQPKLVVADEPTASLDPTTQREALNLFKDLRERLGIAIIFITHNPGLLAGFADRVLVLYAGRVVECGPVQDVLFSAQHPYTKALLQCVPEFDEPPPRSGRTKLKVIEGVSPYSASRAEACAFAPRCADRMDACQRRQPVGVALTETHSVFCFKFASKQ
jgi:peptide/nickel transport system ATP-binding protein/oligopeptide transport system ATP-binding protein